MARGSERRGSFSGRLDRRTFLGGAALALLWPGRTLGAEQGATDAGRPALAPATRRLLVTSQFVYVSPLKADGTESTCHGEVWFLWEDAVIVNSRRGTWKVKALERGLDRARIWVGDYGRWKGILPGGSTNEDFRKGPSFEARASFETDRSVLERLIETYEDKYAGEFDRWREDMRTGFYSGKRKLIRYEPIL